MPYALLENDDLSPYSKDHLEGAVSQKIPNEDSTTETAKII